MNTHTKKWDTLTKWAMATFVLGLIGGIAVLVLTDTNWPLVSLFVFVSFAGLVTSFIGAVKAFGGLKTGGITLIIGLMFFVAGQGFLGMAETYNIFGRGFTELIYQNYAIGYLLRDFGILVFVPGGITAIVTYLRRILRAVEDETRPGQ